jgi:hypothetical protein
LDQLCYPNQPPGITLRELLNILHIDGTIQSEFLMHALLALSAAHLEKLSRSDLTKVTQSHRLNAIKGLNERLNKPLQTAEDGDAIIATCFALLMQSWYMDDGLESFLVMTRSCDLMTKHVRAQKVGSILASDNFNSRIENMRPRLKGAACFNLEFLQTASQSLDALVPLCNNTYEMELLLRFQQCIASLMNSPMQGRLAQIEQNLVN